MFQKLIHSKAFYVFLLIFVVGFFLRAYNFEAWLHFELDQARDATLVDEAVQDIGNLPLLGPRAAGTFARLGPWFYYLEYFFALAFGNPPVGGAVAILFFACLSLPMFYFLFQRYFSTEKTLALTALYAASLYFITYARFGWNPNLLPFFILFLMYALLRAFSREKKNNGWWLLSAATAFALLSQFHFLALIVFGLTGLGFLLYCRPKINWKFWVGSILIVIFFYFPVIVNDIKTGGKNLDEFSRAFTKKSDDKDNHNLVEKVAKDVTENALYYWIIISGAQTGDLPNLEIRGFPDIKCAQYCRDHLGEGLLALLIFIAGGSLLVYKVGRQIKIRDAKQDFLVLNLILAGTSFIIFIPLAFDLSARFFLIIMPLPFLFVGILLDLIPKRYKLIYWSLIGMLILSNLYFTQRFFIELKNTKNTAYELPRDRILKQKTRITLEQERAIINAIEEVYNQNGYPVIYESQPEFKRALAYLLDQKKIPRDGLSLKQICREANYFLILRTQSDQNKIKEKLVTNFNFETEQNFGTLTLTLLSLKKETATCEQFNVKKFRNYKNEGGSSAKRYTWKEILSKK